MSPAQPSDKAGLSIGNDTDWNDLQNDEPDLCFMFLLYQEVPP